MYNLAGEELPALSNGSGLLLVGVVEGVWVSDSVRRCRGGPLRVTGFSPLSRSCSSDSLFRFRSEYGQLIALKDKDTKKGDLENETCVVLPPTMSTILKEVLSESENIFVTSQIKSCVSVY